MKCFAVSKVTTRIWMLSFGIDTAPESFCNSLIALSMILCSKVSPEICCSGVSSCYCCYENHTAGSKPIWKLFFIVPVENWIRSLCVKKIISERCELVKLCHINCSGPVFWDTVEYSRVFTMMFWCFCGRAVFSCKYCCLTRIWDDVKLYLLLVLKAKH